jgi:NAD(P)-dependent dehydrogenase (short-subunit alcohol dehydrogenase family)
MDISKIYDFTGKTAVITGGTGVLGTAMTAVLVGVGANVAVISRHPEIYNKMDHSMMDAGPGSYTLVYGDVLKRELLEEALQTIEDHFGLVDMLINAAGGNHPHATTNQDNPFFDLPRDALGFVFDLNVMGTILPSQVFGKSMIASREGVILNISSMSAFSPLTRIIAYSAAKAGVNNFTQWLAVHMAQEYSPHIRVNAIAPGFFIAKQNRALLLNEDDTLTARGKRIIEHTPMGRFGNPEDLVGTMLWLLSPASKFVTGVVVPVDGGFSAFSGV